MEILTVAKIDQNNVLSDEVMRVSQYPSSPASIATELGGLAMKFARVERIPRYDEKTRENDAEHSFMLSLVATELASELYGEEMNSGLITQYAMVHDLIEVKTGDIATFHYDANDMSAKHATEQAALEELLNELPPYTAQLLRDYEDQKTPESRFVKAVDKLLPVIVDILGCGKKVMKEDYGVTNIVDLKKSHLKLHTRIATSFAEFPQIVEAHELLCELFAIEFDITQKR